MKNLLTILVTVLYVAAVTSLAKFGAACDELRDGVLVLLDRCLMDNDDEVRDRAILYLQVLKQNQKALSSTFILNREFIASSTSMSCGPQKPAE